MANRPCPNAFPKMLAIPTASDGAPPVRANSVASPIEWASAVICSGVTAKPHDEMAALTTTGHADRLSIVVAGWTDRFEG